jgi:hypothetical protein
MRGRAIPALRMVVSASESACSMRSVLICYGATLSATCEVARESHRPSRTFISPKYAVCPVRWANNWCSSLKRQPPACNAALLSGAKVMPSMRPESARSTSAQQFLDAVYKVDSSTGLSPLIVAAQFRALRDFATDNSGHRLILTPLKSSGYSLTTKRLLFDDKVAFAGGVALRVSVMQPDGKAAYERIFFRQSGWIRAEFNTDGELPKQNF